MRYKFLLQVFMLFSFSNFLNAQVSIIASNILAEKGEIIEVDVTVANYKEIVGTQFTISWDSTILDFRAVSNFGLPQMSEQSFGTNEASSGGIGFLWIDNSINGVTVEDSATIFTLTYEVIGEAGKTTTVAFTDSISLIEVVDKDGMVEVDLQPGLITVDGISASTNYKHSNIFLGQNSPNPFQDKTLISFELEETTVTYFSIYNLQGQKIFEKNERLSAGKHSMEINKSVLPAKGMYLYRLQTPQYQVSKALILN